MFHIERRNRKSIPLMLESLEERLTPSGGNPTVTQTAGGYTALTAAVAADTAANTNYVIQITGSFTFNSGGQVSISKLGAGSTLTLSGQNGTNFTLTGNGNRLFTIGSGQNVAFADLTLTGGSVTNSKGNAQGGAILDQGGNVTLSKVIVEGNTVKGGTAEGGGVYASGAGNLAIRDSILNDNSAHGVSGANATVAGAKGSAGGSAYGGGLYVAGSGWTVTLIGDTLSDNTAIGGNGGNGAAGSNATAPNTSGGTGGAGGNAGDVLGGAAYFFVSDKGSGNLTILNDLSAPISDPSIMIDNTAQAGTGGNGGAGGNSTGTALDSFGGGGGVSGTAEGGALYVSSAAGATVNVNIGNSTFYANKAATGNDGKVGAFGTGGRFEPPALAPSPPPASPNGPFAAGGGLALGDGNITMVNSTVAKNTAINTAVPQYVGGAIPWRISPGPAWGAGIYDNDTGTVILDNNTITQNTVSGGSVYPSLPPPASSVTGAGVFVASGNPTLLNNLIQGNQNANSSASDLASNGIALSNASNNFIGTTSANTVNTTSNIVGNAQVQLGNVVGVDANGKPTGGPIYYPLLPGVVSIGAGTTSVLGVIAGVEGTTAANAVDEIGSPRSHNGSIDLGAIQTVTTPPPSPPSPASPPSSPAPSALNVPPLLAFFDSLLGRAVTTNPEVTDAVTYSAFGIPLIVAFYDSSGGFLSATVLGINVPNWFWYL